VAAVAEGALIGAYSFTRHRGRSASDEKAPVADITVVTRLARDKGANAAAARAQEVASAVHLTRDLINTAPGDLPPAAFADATVAAGQGEPAQGDSARREGTRERAATAASSGWALARHARRGW
jgi:leucyl aminopeptidase